MKSLKSLIILGTFGGFACYAQRDEMSQYDNYTSKTNEHLFVFPFFWEKGLRRSELLFRFASVRNELNT